ncbi:MAG: TrmB family transcriptional regulator [Candidatus Nanoarchaeia archaeon]
MENIEKILSEIGLNKNEIKVYIDLIKNGSSTPTETSKRTGIHRSNAHDSLSSLREKGYVYEQIGQDKKTFSPVNPDEIKQYFKEKEKDVNEAVKKLKQFLKKPARKQGVSIFQNIYAVRERLLELLDEKQPIYIYGFSSLLLEKIGRDFFHEFNKKREKQQIELKCICNQDFPKQREYQYTHHKKLSKQYDASVITILCKPRLLIIILEEPISSILIINEDIANAFENYAKILWEKAS